MSALPTSPDMQLQSILQRIRQPPAVPLSLTSIRQTITDCRTALRSSSADDSLDAASISAFCASQGYTALQSWIWRKDIIAELAVAAASDPEVAEDVLQWFATPLPAMEAFVALVAATKAVGAMRGGAGAAAESRVSSQLQSVHALLRTAAQRFIDLQPRVTELLEEVCEHESKRRTNKPTSGSVAAARQQALESQAGAAARAQTEREVQRVNAVTAAGAASSHLVPAISSATAHALPLSPHAQMVLDQLCSFPDLLANTLQGDLPYALSHRSWHSAVAAQTHLFIATHSAAAASPSSAFLSPLSNLFTKMVRLGQSDVMLDALCEPLLAHCQSLAPVPSASASASSSAAAAASSSSVSPSLLLSSPLLHSYALVFQGVGVQAAEKFVEGLLKWLGVKWKSLRDERAQAMDAEGAAAMTMEASFAARGRAVLSILPSLFPLAYFESTPVFALLCCNRLLLARISLPSAALGVLVDYLWQLSLAKLDRLSPQEATKIREAHQTLLDQVLVQVLQVWSGIGSGGSGVDSASPSSATAALSGEAQVQLGKVVLLMLTKIDAEVCGGAPPPKPRKPKSKGKEPPQESEIKSLGSFANAAAVSYLLSGIGSRISSPLPPVRANAMQIAKVFSRMMGGKENEIDFEEGTDDAEEEEDPEHVAQRNQLASLTPASMINPAHLGGRILTTPMDPSSPLRPHSLEDDERDLRKVALPHFMRDAIDFIYKHADSFDHIEAALEALPKLIARNTADLPTLSRDLTVALLNLGSNVFLETSPKLARLRLDSLVSLCSTYRNTDVRALSDAVSDLISQFFSSNYSMGTKLEMLDVMRMAAERLAQFDGGAGGADKAVVASSAAASQPLIQEVSSSSSRTASLVPINTPLYSSSSSAAAVSSTLAHHQSIIRARVEARTRRWGGTKIANAAGASTAAAAPTGPKYSINRFAPVAHLFFFPLMRQIDSAQSMVHLRQHDGLLLLRLLHTISGFLPASSGLAQALPMVTRNMSKTLMELLMALWSGARGASASAQGGGGGGAGTSEIGLRRMVLFALSRILVVYNEILFVDDFSIELPELVSWLTGAVQSDPDHECRQLAQANLYFLRQLVGNPFEQMFKNEENNAAQANIRASAQLPTIRF